MKASILPDLLDCIEIIPVTFMALFHVVNPIGSGILFLNLTPQAEDKTRRKLAKKIALNSFLILLVILLVGVYILKIFGISIPIIQMCGGFLIMLMGWKALSDDDSINESNQKFYVDNHQDSDTDYFKKVFSPFTFPFTVGPGSIAVTLTVAAQAQSGTLRSDIFQYIGAFVSIILVTVTIYICYRYAHILMKRVPENLRMVIMRILSFILLCIGGQIVFNGLTEFIHQLH